MGPLTAGHLRAVPAVPARAVLRSPADLDADDLRAWRELAAAALEPNPFFEPELVLPAVRHLREPGVALAVVEDSDGWLACLPVRRLPRWRRIPGAALSAWGHTHGFLNTPLVHRRASDETPRLLLDLLLGRGGVGFLVLEHLAAGPVQRALQEALVERGTAAIAYETAERAVLVRREDPSGYLAAYGAKRRRELRRQWRLLEEATGSELMVADRATEPRAHDAFLDLEAAGWKGREGTAFRTVSGHADFARELMTAFAQQGRLELLSLESAGRPLAMKCNVLAGDGVFCFKIAHDEELARFSPGVQLEARYTQLFHERERATWADSCAAPDNAMINRLWPDRRTVSTLVVPASGARGALGATAVHGVAQLRRRLGRAA